MDKKYLLGIDIGTLGSKGIIVDYELNVVATQFIEHGLLIPKPGWAEQEADKIWWGDFRKLSKVLLKEAAIDPKDIAGIGVSALFADMLPLDKEGRSLRPGILYGIDTRASKEIKWIEEQIDKERIFDVCGNMLTSQSVGPKILWFKEHEPNKFKKTHKILSATGYIVFKLTGNFTVDNVIASFFHPFFNLSKIKWEDEIFEQIGIPRNLLPQNKWSTEIAGYITEEASKETGFAKGTPVIVGTGDALASLVSVGALKDREAIFMYATTGCIFTTLKEKATNPNLWSFAHCLKGKYSIAGGMATSGAIVRWFRDQFGYKEKKIEKEKKLDAYQLLDDQAVKIAPGSDGLIILPYFSGERTPLNDELARGTIIGLTLSHTKAHIYRAILESVGYGFRHHLDEMKKSKVLPKRVFAIDGGAKSALWRKIVSNITGVTQEYVSKPLGAPFGDAYLAGLGIGMFKDFKPLLSSVEIEDTTKPNIELKKKYDKYYLIYKKLYPHIKEDVHNLAKLSLRER
jgi:xylulokinase